ncbi:MAG: hypothetical protein V1797_03780 [Pseudomonadota bacterium]
METFGPMRPLQADADFAQRRRLALAGLEPGALDPEMRGPVAGLNRLRHCFTLQSCQGHILVPGQGPPAGWERRPVEPPPARALYQLAYLALVVRNGRAGGDLLGDLAALAAGEAEFMQLGCADWFWREQGQVNSYVVQVAPRRRQGLDWFEMDRAEAGAWLRARGRFLAGLAGLAAAEA